MKTTETTQTAMQAMEVYLSASDRPEALRVTQNGRVEVVSIFTVLFSRLAGTFNLTKNINGTNHDWKSKAYEAVLQKMTKEVAFVTGHVKNKDKETIGKLLKKTIRSSNDNPNLDWRDQLSDQISKLNKDEDTTALADALKYIIFLGRPENAALYPYVRKQLIAKEKFSDALKNGLTNFLTKKYGLPSDSAKNAAKTMHHLMTKYESSVTEAWFITSRAGQMALNKEVTNPQETALPLAYLQIRHRLTLDEAKIIYMTLCEQGKSVANEREKVSVMRIYGAAFDEADAIVSFAQSLEKIAPNKLSQAQRIEIAWLRLHEGMEPDEATLTSLEAGRLNGRLPSQRQAALQKTHTTLTQKIKQDFSQAMPIGWPDDWDSMPDGSRRLKKVDKFQKEFMTFFEGSLNDCVIDEKQGLSVKFIQDVGRSNFKFGAGNSGVTVLTDKIKARAELEKFVPDAMARQTLSKALFQAGGNGLEAAMGLALKQPSQTQFSIMSLDTKTDDQEAKPDFRISLQHTDDGKVRVGYTLYMKHFTLTNTNTGDQLPVNSRYSSRTPATAKDHTARAMALIEFDYAELSKGNLEPKWVRPPELRLTIEPDEETLMKNLIDKIL